MKCKLCREGEATCFDRDAPWKKKESICQDCHEKRLKGDIMHILTVEKKRRQRNETP